MLWIKSRSGKSLLNLYCCSLAELVTGTRILKFLSSWSVVKPYILVFFFFQAEDGIRDADVTGVQTCALPIYAGASLACAKQARPIRHHRSSRRRTRHRIDGALRVGEDSRARHTRSARSDSLRSEERRVGKECRFGWAPEE